MLEYPSRSNLNSFFRVFSGPRLRVLNFLVPTGIVDIHNREEPSS